MTQILTTKSRKADGRDGWYLITPAQAAALLEQRAKNRSLRDFRAQKIAADILDHAWRPNGESIIFDDKGRLNDGQHRLRACVLADKPIEVYCIFGISWKVFDSLDQGAGRGGDDLAAVMDFSNASLVSALTRLSIDYTEGNIGITGLPKMSSAKLRGYMHLHRERLAAAAAVAVTFQKGIRTLLPLSHACFVYYMNVEQHPDKALEFLEKLATGAGLHKDDAILLFRKRMTDLKGEKHTVLKGHKIALLIKAWNAFLANKPISLLRWKSDVETFPRFD
jgi:hypothetical protein